MLPGFNHNLRTGGLIFHVQTEDGGLANPLVQTHIFFGGNVLATRRRSYEKFVGAANRDEVIMAMMKDQHKGMMKDLVEGKFRSVQELLQRLAAPVEGEEEKETMVETPSPLAAPPAPPKTPPAASLPRAEPPGLAPLGRSEGASPTGEANASPPLGNRAAVPPRETTPRPHRQPEDPVESLLPPDGETKKVATFEPGSYADKTLDELIMEFLEDEHRKLK